MVGQIDRPQCEVECRWAIVGCTRSMGEGMRVDTGLRAVSVDEDGELCSVCCFALSMSLLTTMSTFVTVVGGSVSTLTTTTLLLLRPGCLLLLLGEFGVSLLALHSTKLVRLVTVACGRVLRVLFEGQSGHCNNLIRFESFDVCQLSLVNELSYNLHRRREFRDQNHSLHGERDLKVCFLEIGEVGCNRLQGRSGMGVQWDSCGQELPMEGEAQCTGTRRKEEGCR